MGRRKKGRHISGWVAIDKPAGLTSAKVSGAVRALFNAQKAGHAGTLDPLATGILPVALGEATKTMPHIVDSRKTYLFTIRWGVETRTGDREGEMSATSPNRPGRAQTETALEGFLGDTEQVPPQFSAVKINGQRACDIARAGGNSQIEPRKVTIFRARLLDMPDPDHADFEITCSRGTYVRSFAQDLAKTLGTLGHITALRRTQVGCFGEKDAISLDKLVGLGHSAAACGHLEACLKPLETVLDDIPAQAVSGQDSARLKRGQAVVLRGRDAPVFEGTVLATHAGEPVALTTYERGALKPVRVFNLP